MTINTLYTRNSIVIFLFFLCLYGIIVFRLYYIQVRHVSFFTQRGSHQYHIICNQSPSRAPLYDCTGKHYIAMNKDCISAFITPHKITEPEKLISFLTTHFPAAKERLTSHHNKLFMYVKRHLSNEQLNLIRNAQLPDIHLLHETSRFYPEDSLGPVIGITDIDNTGLFGLELQYNELLAGKPTTYTLERDARSGYFYFNRTVNNVGTAAQPLILTIDSTLQFLIKEELKNTIEHFQAKEGAVLVMNPDNGEIMSMINIPYFDPNNIEHLNLEDTKNKIICEQYELGSVMKIFAALAALEEKVVTPDELIDCRNTKTTWFDGRKINTTTADGIISFKDVIRRSNNIGIAQITKRLGTKLYDHYQKIGFGKKTGIDFPGEAQGFINPPHNWSKQSLISLSYGYELSLSLLQLGCVMCMIAHDGHTITPTLLKNTLHQPSYQSLYSPESIAFIQDILAYTVRPETQEQARNHGYILRRKTGTANMLIDGFYDTTQNLFTCAGYVQKDNYKRVIVTFVKQIKQHNLLASKVAAPLFDQVARTLLIHDHII